MTDAYWIDGTPYCYGCADDPDVPALSPEDRKRATVAPGVGQCGSCREGFPAPEERHDQ